MPRISCFSPFARTDLHIFFVLDASDNLSKDGKLDVLNRNMQEMVEILREIAQHNSDVNFKIAVLAYGTNCCWLTENGPENVADFVWKKLKTSGSANLGNALKELNDKLNFHSWMNSMIGALMPVIVFVSGGVAADNWKSELDMLRENRRFRRATKIGFNFGSPASKEILAFIVGTSEAVFQASDMDFFKMIVRQARHLLPTS